MIYRRILLPLPVPQVYLTLLIFLILLIFPLALTAENSTKKSGTVVVEFGPDNALERAGIRIGDVLHSWEREPTPPANPTRAAGSLNTFFDWYWLTTEHVPRGPIKLRGERDGEPLEIIVPPGDWRTIIRPVLDEKTAAHYLAVRELSKKDDFNELDRRTEAFLEAYRTILTPITVCWLQTLAGQYSSKGKDHKRALIWYQKALNSTQDPIAQIYILQSMGLTHQEEKDYTRAEELYRKALHISETTWGENLMTAISIKALYLLAWRERKMEQMEKYAQKVAELLEKNAPSSLLQADTLNIFGILASRASDLEQGRLYHEKALSIRRRLNPDGTMVAESLTGLGGISFRKGDFESALASYTEARRILETKSPSNEALPTLYSNIGRTHSVLGALEVAEEMFLKAAAIYPKNAPMATIELVTTYNSLSILSQRRGDLAQAEAWSQQAVQELQKTAPKSEEMAGALRTLGALRYHSGDFDRAADYFQEALTLSQQTNQDDRTEALYMLARVLHNKGDLKRAEELYREALAIRERLAPNSMPTASILHNLGDLYRDRNDFDTALTYLHNALKIQEKTTPHSPDTAITLKQIGSILRRIGKTEEALQIHYRALAIVEVAAPGTSTEADILYESSQDLENMGRSAEALTMLRRCVGALDSQFRKLGAEENRIIFRNRFSSYYWAFIHALYQAHRTEESFQALEAYRAQSFLVLLMERDLVFADLPYELEAERRRLAADYDAAQRELIETNPIPAENRRTSEKHIREIREQQTVLTTKIRALSPKLASLRYPEPLGLKEALGSLDTGTALISFSVGEQEALVFALAIGSGLTVHQIPVGRIELERKVSDLLSLLKSRDLQPLRQVVFQDTSQQLYETLFRPVEKTLERADRILIIPDGPLHNLPFSTLIRRLPEESGALGQTRQYLAEWKPLHFVLSTTVYSEIKKSRATPKVEKASEGTFVAFGDPFYPEGLRVKAHESIADPHVSRAAKDFRFDPLPWSAREISGIAGLFSGNAHIYLQMDATEDKAKSVGREAKYLHFATHGVVDTTFPLDSSLILTIPKEFIRGKENGVLQAWEIFERVRLDADLVALSACESGLGKEMGGEGLIGLTRAFQYAGARSVMASLWKISDRTTAELMVRFYKHLKAGLPKDEALRAAQMELIRGPIQVKNEKGEIEEIDASAPYYWAAFQIYGDWQ